MTDDDNTPHDPQSEQPTPTGAVAAVKQLTEWANNPRHFGYVGMGHDMKVVLAAYDRQKKIQRGWLIARTSFERRSVV